MVCELMGEELTSWCGTQTLWYRGQKGAVWPWEVYFRKHKHTLPVYLNISLSVYCMYCTFQTDRQTDRPHLESNQRPSPFLLPSLLPCLSSHPERGSGEVGVVGQTGPAVWPQTSLSVCMWEGVIYKPYYRPAYTVDLTQSYFTASSRNTAGLEVWQHESICGVSIGHTHIHI